jgi:DNA-binding CsgD family transcriptional regulator
MQQSSAEAELDKLAGLCSSLRLHDKASQVAGNLLDPIASVLGAESAAFRHLDLRHDRPRIMNLASIGVASTVADDYLAHFYRFDPFLDRLACIPDLADSGVAFPQSGNEFRSYFRNFLQPNGLVRHAGFMLLDETANQAWIFNFHRPAAAPEFADLELARVRLIRACLQGQATGASSTDARIPDTGELSDLTMREHEVVMAVAHGLGNKQIAARLGISPRTVENHLRSIYDKLQINSRTQLVSLLYRINYNAAAGNRE